MVHKIFDFYKLFHDCLKLFPKQERYSLGQKVENTILEILELILSASLTNIYKKELLKKANIKTDLLKYLIRLAHETESIKMKHYFILEEELLNIGKMIGGWLRSINK